MFVRLWNFELSKKKEELSVIEEEPQIEGKKLGKTIFLQFRRSFFSGESNTFSSFENGEPFAEVSLLVVGKLLVLRAKL